jgi:hypothetical protein
MPQHLSDSGEDRLEGAPVLILWLMVTAIFCFLISLATFAFLWIYPMI